jgi:hypothetical protein
MTIPSCANSAQNAGNEGDTLWWRQLLLQEEAFQEEEAFQATPPNGEGSA